MSLKRALARPVPDWMAAAYPNYPSLAFIKEECYWPTQVGLDEKFVPTLVFTNQGGKGWGWWGFRYKGVEFVQDTFIAEPGMRSTVGGEITIRGFLEGIEAWEASKTVDIAFLAGFSFADEYHATDTWPQSTYVEVKAGLKVPAWALVALGVVVVGGGIAMVVSR